MSAFYEIAKHVCPIEAIRALIGLHTIPSLCTVCGETH